MASNSASPAAIAASPAEGLDEHALRRHVFAWDLWLLICGVALAPAPSGFRRATSHDRASSQAGAGRRHPNPVPRSGCALRVDIRLEERA